MAKKQKLIVPVESEVVKPVKAVKATVEEKKPEVEEDELNVPLTKEFAYVCLILNVVLPGIGSLLCAFLDPNGFNIVKFLTGFVLFIMVFFCEGGGGCWMMSVIDGYLIFCKTSEPDLLFTPRKED